MAVIFLAHGGMAHVDEEDLEAASRIMWQVWEMHPSGRSAAWVRLQRNKRRFDLFLHRLIAVRMDPSLAKRHFTVTPVDGDYLNCRRENLETAIRKKGARSGGRRQQFANFAPDGSLSDVWRPVVAAQGR